MQATNSNTPMHTNSFQALVADMSETMPECMTEEVVSNGVCRNIRRLNWPDKQEYVRSFLYNNKVGLLNLLETKVKEENDSKVVAKTFVVRMWQHCFTLNTKGRI